eukprot:gene17011-biopygen17243
MAYVWWMQNHSKDGKTRA